jgi:phenylpropionate dioxygenase-like ring-hydroxylating dioxygenase large terminal subunit
MLGERAFVIRTEEGVRGFHNVCRHRAHAVLPDRQGTAPAIIRCPYHAWCYGWDGRLKAAAAKATLPGLDMASHGLVPLDCEVFMGFVFVRLRPGGPSVAERMAPHAAELAHYRFEDMQPIADFWIGDIDADWKNVWDNYLEDYHFPTGHPGLYALMSTEYEREPDQAGRTIRLSHSLRDRLKGGGGGWAARMYASLLPEREDLPADLRRRWSYFFLYPAVTIEPYPDLVDYLHVEPIGPGRSRIRWRCYGLPDSSRVMRAVRWLNLRLNYDVHDEDAALVTSVQKGLASSAYRMGVLGEKETAVRAFQSWIRADMPEAAR